jgi:hypothetical protein
LRLTQYATTETWLATSDRGLAYAESALALRWLAEHFGRETLGQVVRQTTGPALFADAFTQGFGFSLEEFEPVLEAALRASLLHS